MTTTNTTLDAVLMAKHLRLGDTLFKYLERGDRFRFGYSNGTRSPLYVKVRGGYRNAADPNGPVFKTGSKTGVFKELTDG